MNLAFHIMAQLHSLCNPLFKDRLKEEISSFLPLLVSLIFILSSCSPTNTDNFTTIQTDTPFDFHAIEEFDGQLYATGGNVWLRSDLAISPDGSSWSTDSLTNKSLFDLYSDKNNLYGVGNDGYIFSGNPELELSRTKYWDLLRSFTSAEENFIAAGGKDFNKGWMYKVNAALTVDTAHYFAHEILDVKCNSLGTCIACGYGAILRSDDFGTSWERSQENGDYYNSIGVNQNNEFFIVGYSGTIITSRDNGNTWTKLKNGHSPLANNKPFRKIKFEKNRGIIVGDNGLVWTSDDNGSTWTDQSIHTDLDLFDLEYYNGSTYCASEGGKIIRLID